MANTNINRPTRKDSLFSTVTEITTNTSVTLSKSSAPYKYLLALFNTSATNASSSRGYVFVPLASDSPWLPLAIQGTVGSVRTDCPNETTLAVYGKYGFDTLYLIRVEGVY